mgnify:CR=1 FL=1
MKKKKIIWVTILSFLYYTFACSVYKTEKISIKEYCDSTITIQQMHKFNKDTINMVNKCLKFVSKQKLIRGINEDDEYIAYDIKDVCEIGISDYNFVKIKANQSHNKISEIVLVNNYLVKFDSSGALINYDEGIISGKNKSNQFIDYQINQVKGVCSNKPDTIRKIDLTKNTKISNILLNNSKLIVFKNNSGEYIENDEGFVYGDNFVNKSDIDSVLIKTKDVPLSILSTIGVIGIVILILVLIVGPPKIDFNLGKI